MIPIDIPEAKKSFYFPENLAECDAKQYADMAKLLYMFRSGEINYFEFRTLAVYALMGMKLERKKIKSEKDIPEKDLPKWENIFRLSELVDSFFEKNETDEGVRLEVKTFYVQNHNPEFHWISNKIPKKFIGPEDAFTNVSFGQYVDALEEYIYHSQTGDLQSLRNLFAIFYLLPNEVYNEDVSKKRAKTDFRLVDIRFLYGMFLFFESMQKYILSGEVLIMGNTIDLSLIYQSTGDEKPSDIPGLGMHSIVHDIAESGVFGSTNEVRETKMWKVLLRLYELKKKALDEKANEKKTTV